MTPILGVIASANQGQFISYTDYASITTTTLGTATATITFSSIPATYKHLQIRVLARSDRSAGVDIMSMRMNSDTAANYSDHLLYGDGTTAQTDVNINATKINIQRLASDNLSANIFSDFVIDILDYADTNKYKTIRYLSGYDANGSGRVGLGSGSWRNTAAVTSITLDSAFSANYKQYSSFALYGIKG